VHDERRVVLHDSNVGVEDEDDSEVDSEMTTAEEEEEEEDGRVGLSIHNVRPHALRLMMVFVKLDNKVIRVAHDGHT
jgi:hypothetical protein